MVASTANIDATEVLRATARIQRHLAIKNKNWHDVIVLIAIGRMKVASISTLSGWTGLIQPTTSTIISKFEKLGLIKKERDLNDWRAVKVILTTKGQDEYEMLEQFLGSIAL
jgi:DNA-binding MarR family transcriptional regulator